MTPNTTLAGRTPAAARAWRLLAGGLAFVAVTLLSACGGGGGGDTAGVGTGGTGSFSVGTVTGFGSVFVNGVRYEDNGARLVDDDGTVKVLGSDDNPLKVGMVVEVTGSVDDSGTVRTATQIAYGAEIKGPVTAVDVAAGTFNVFGTTVRTTTTTVYDNFGGVAALATGNVVEVHGQPDTNGRIVATYVEREATSVAAFVAGGGEYRLRGALAGLSGSNPAYTFTMRGVAIRTDASTRFDGTPADGISVSVRLNPMQQGDGRYLAAQLKVRTASYDNSSAAAEGEVEGYVSDFIGAASAFRVAGYPVRLASAVVYEDGVATDLTNDIRVEAKGRIDNGVLVVTKLEFKSRDDNGDGNDDNVSSGSQEFEFKGTAACVSCGATSGTFTIKGVTVSYDASTEFRDGLSGATLNGKAVEVKSAGQVASTGTTYRATRIEPDN
jgi:Domain of unknown function (DUF5666)